MRHRTHVSEGNDLVLRVENGRLEHLVVPHSDIFDIDGKGLTVHDLKPGTKPTQTITTSTTPRFVTTVRTQATRNLAVR